MRIGVYETKSREYKTWTKRYKREAIKNFIHENIVVEIFKTK